MTPTKPKPVKHFPARIGTTPHGMTIYIARCGYASDNRKEFIDEMQRAKVTCPKCLKGGKR